MPGWVKLYRKLLKNPIMQKPGMLQLWIYCLLRANHEPGRAFFGKNEILVQPGQFVTGRFELAHELGVKPITGYKRLQTLRKTGFLNTKSNNKNTLVTIVNWGLYQSAELNDNNKDNNKVTTKEQQSNTNKNVKNEKNKRNIYKEKISEYTNNKELQTTLFDFLKMRKEINSKMTDRALVLLLNKLDKLADNDKQKIEILEQSIERSWKSVFPLRNDLQPRGHPVAQINNFKQRDIPEDFDDKFFNNREV